MSRYWNADRQSAVDSVPRDAVLEILAGLEAANVFLRQLGEVEVIAVRRQPLYRVRSTSSKS
jgi:hypothetical protein